MTVGWICPVCGAGVAPSEAAHCASEAPLAAPREAAQEALLPGAAVAREARISLSKPLTTAPQRKYQYNDPDFNAFYALWPRKRSKEAALRAWQAALRGGAPASAIIDAAAREAKRVKRLGIELRHVPYPATWLNAAGWLDEDDSPPEAGDTDPAFVVGTPEYQARIATEEQRAIEALS